MKISKVDDATLQMIQQYQKTDRVEDRSQEKPEKAAASLVPEEKVNLSTTAKDVQTLKNAISSLPDVREDKVQALREQIEKGAYKVDAEKVAEKMVGESLLDVLS
ncbi:MAG TPA: flagellar biosynthesis anti-sigma factor FlgM [Syntrophales bacterium]|nr:flagellar biosynthesis anti-sigma factor FlgM [Syntrophales bacterium]HQG82771.1 flagellar biosynthesis anti-sigma factor FlgM [Syntrophales bacterium]HQK48720.1 flagellar biosynthesis anti-sigma factor FlgM [Syntrophales bacterium]HQM90717.1 flagellar biosynthesis anti-sigma factor FlgM [Syntrophales bacterium]